jgi:hypothetical protein
LLQDPWVAARIDAAVNPYVGRLSAGEIEWMREQLAETLQEEDSAARLLHRARPRVVEESGEVERGAVVTPLSHARRARPKTAG